MSHELRTPLTSISGYVELMIEGEAGSLNQEQLSFLGVVRRNADRLLRLVGDLLFAAQSDARQVEFERAPVDLLPLIMHAFEAARPAAADREIELALETESVGGLVGDAGRLGQMIDNLMSNALKFTPLGGTVSLRLSQRGETAQIEIADTGMGISDDDQQRLFERFFRTSAATEQAIQGTGLGLSIAAAIAEGHGGTIEVTSEVGRGTTFTSSSRSSSFPAQPPPDVIVGSCRGSSRSTSERLPFARRSSGPRRTKVTPLGVTTLVRAIRRA